MSEGIEEVQDLDDTTPEQEGIEEIRSTDIVFDCPVCGHNLVIDYRGAGLQVPCSECGNQILAPIPEGMRVSDLDLEPGEVLSQLFHTRQLLQKSEQQVAELGATLKSLRDSRTQQEVSHAQTLRRTAEAISVCNTLIRSHNDQVQMINKIMALLHDETK